MFDMMRGIPTTLNDSLLEADTTGAESAGVNFLGSAINQYLKVFSHLR